MSGDNQTTTNNVVPLFRDVKRNWRCDGSSVFCILDPCEDCIGSDVDETERADMADKPADAVQDDKAAAETTHPDYRCSDCGGGNPVWFAPNKVWNLVMGGPEAHDDPGGIVCPCCFIRRAEAAGIIPTAWELRLEELHANTTDTPHREPRFDVIRNSADLYGAVYRIVSVLAAHDLSQSRDLCQIATKVLPHLPKPAEDANVWEWQRCLDKADELTIWALTDPQQTGSADV